MRKTIIFGLAAALLTGWAVAGETIRLTRDDAGSERQVAVGSELTVTLPLQDGTGFLWRAMPAEGGANVLAEAAVRIERGGSTEPVLGKWVDQVITLRAQSAGRGRIAYELIRPWETGPGAENFVVTVIAQ